MKDVFEINIMTITYARQTVGRRVWRVITYDKCGCVSQRNQLCDGIESKKNPLRHRDLNMLNIFLVSNVNSALNTFVRCLISNNIRKIDYDCHVTILVHKIP